MLDGKESREPDTPWLDTRLAARVFSALAVSSLGVGCRPCRACDLWCWQKNITVTLWFEARSLHASQVIIERKPLYGQLCCRFHCGKSCGNPFIELTFGQCWCRALRYFRETRLHEGVKLWRAHTHTMRTVKTRTNKKKAVKERSSGAAQQP